MAEFRAWITVMGVPGGKELNDAAAAAEAAARTLQEYLGRVVKSPLTSFSTARVRTNPSSSDLGPRDTLIHLTVGSLIKPALEADGATVQVSGTGTAGGATSPVGSNGVLSEVYWTYVKNHGTSTAVRGTLIAGQAFHELVHNKYFAKSSDPLENNRYVHANGGQGLLMAHPNLGALQQKPNSANVAFAARHLDNSIRQYPYCVMLGY